MKTILIVVEGGIIQDVLGIPEGVQVVVCDYDVEGVDIEGYIENGRLFRVNGKLCTQIAYEANEDTTGEMDTDDAIPVTEIVKDDEEDAR